MNDPIEHDKARHAADVERRSFLGQVATLGAAALFAGPRAANAAQDVLRIGYIHPRTGPFAPFSEADDFLLTQIRKALAPGLVIGGKRYAVEILVRDDESNPTRQANLAADLINKDNVDLMLAQVSIGPDVSQQCELNGVPCISTMGPWEAWMFPMHGNPHVGFKDVFHFFWGIDDIAHVYVDMWNGQSTNKVVGMAWSNDLPGNAMGNPRTGMPADFAGAHYRMVDVGKFPVGANDFSVHIQAFKRADAQIVTGLFNPPEWATFVTQSAQMGFKPRIATPAKALLFPGGFAALGKNSDGMSTEIWWTPAYPFHSSLTGQSSAQLAASYEHATGRQWTQPLGVVHALFEAGVHALKNSGDPKKPRAVADTIRGMQVDTIIGRLDWAHSGIKNVSKIRVVGGQWRIDHKKLGLYVTTNATAPEIPVQRPFEILPGTW